MAFFKKAAPVEEVAPVVEEVKVEEPEVVAFQPVRTTLIGKGITFEGDFVSNEPIEIRGTIRGNVTDTNLVTVFQGAEYHGKAQIANLKNSGYINGEVQCGGLTVFTSTGNMDGSLTTSELRTDAGSGFSGQMIIDRKSAVAPSAPVAQEAPVADAAPAEETVNLAEEGDVAVTEADLFG